MEAAMMLNPEKAGKKAFLSMIYKFFMIYVICGVGGFVIESVWCWIDFGKFTSRTSNLFFPISCIWGLGGVLLTALTMKNRWDHGIYIFTKCVLSGAVFELLCGYLGQALFGVTFWDYTNMPLHIGRYINLPFCLAWGIFGVVWVRRICPAILKALDRPVSSKGRTALSIFLVFMVITQLLTGAALARMNERQKSVSPANRVENLLDICFTDQMLQSFFPKMKDAVTGEKVYIDIQLK